jgi:hypothetical protein
MYFDLLKISFIFCGTGDSTQGLVLSRQVLYHMNYAASPGKCFLTVSSHGEGEKPKRMREQEGVQIHPFIRNPLPK